MEPRKNLMPPASARNQSRPKIEQGQIENYHRRLESAGVVNDEPIIMSYRGNAPRVPNSENLLRIKAKAKDLAVLSKNSSDQEDASTRVSSNYQVHREVNNA